MAVELRLRESVILAEDFQAMVAWYRDVLGFKEVDRFEDEFHYCNLESDSGIKIGIADADEMGVVPIDRSCNTVLLQFEVRDIKEFFEHVEQNGGSIKFGPSFDKKFGFWFGGCADPEGNPFWAVDEKCP